jgi:nicotinamidase-related amidase
MTRNTTSNSTTYELPIPAFFQLSQVEEWKQPTQYAKRFADAQDWKKQHGITSAARDRFKVALMPIDCQLTFCHPDFELYVGGRSGKGAIEDIGRLCEFIYRNLGVITRIHPTLDTHTAFQIFHAAMFLDAAGNAPSAQYPTMVNAVDVDGGKLRINPDAAFAVTGDSSKYIGIQQHLAKYTKTLETPDPTTGRQKIIHTIWPFHAMLGGIGHALVPALEEAIFFHDVARGSQADFQVKGGHPLTENYSVLGPEVPIGTAQKNVKFIEALLKYDMVIIAGEAKSHCVLSTIDDLLAEIAQRGPSLAQKVYLMEDCTSPVVVPGIVDYTDEADEAFRRFAAAGMNVVKSTTPIDQWPGVDGAQLAR